MEGDQQGSLGHGGVMLLITIAAWEANPWKKVNTMKVGWEDVHVAGFQTSGRFQMSLNSIITSCLLNVKYIVAHTLAYFSLL